MKNFNIKIAELLLICSAIMSTTFINAQDGFCSGWEKGYNKGYCYNKNYGCYPTIPICPIPNIGRDTYTDGYNRGFVEGQSGGSQNNSGMYNINPNNSNAGQYNVGQGEDQVFDMSIAEKALQQRYSNGSNQQTYSNSPCQGNCRNGQGALIFANGDKYVGQFKDSKGNGQGTMTWVNGDKCVGEFKDGNCNGQGTFTFASGNKYVGEFKDSKFNGQGTAFFADGDKEVGEFKDGNFMGQGTDGQDATDYIGAIAEYTKAIKLNPNDAHAYLNRGLAKFSLEDDRGAITDCNKAIELNPNYAMAYYLRGSAKLPLKDKDGACLDWSKAGELGYSGAYDSIKEYCH